MNNRGPLLQMFGLTLTVLLLAGCGGGRAEPTPTPTKQPTRTPLPTPGNTFTGRLLLYDDDGMDYQLSINSSTGNTEIDRLYDGYFGSISPDNSYIIYYDSDGMDMRLYDLETKADKPIAKGQAECVQWSPNSKMFSAVIDGVLYVYDLAGTSMIIYEAPSAEYRIRGKVYSELECDTWIATDRFVFQRYKGLMPGSITIESSSPVVANTTTLAIMGNELALVDSPKRWFVRDVCMNGSLVLLDEWGGPLSELYGPYPFIYYHVDLLLSEEFHDFKDFVPRTMNIDLAWDMGFIPNSATCELYVVYSHTSDSDFPMDIFYIDPITLEQHFVYTLEDEDESRSAAIIWHGVWIGDPNNRIIAVEEILPHTDDRYISMINLSSGNRTVIADSQTKGWSGGLRIWTWLP